MSDQSNAARKTYRESRTLTQSAEDYLEAVLEISKNRKVVRTSEIAARLGVRKPSVVVAMRRLKERGYVRQERYGYTELTPAGQAQAQRISHRHEMLFRFLHELLGVPVTTAQADACRMEHALSPLTIRRLFRYLESVGSRTSQAPRRSQSTRDAEGQG